LPGNQSNYQPRFLNKLRIGSPCFPSFGVQRPILKDSAGTFLQLGRRVDIKSKEEVMGFGRGALLWLLGVPLPIIILLALFWHH
jgi:hypothetical protein